MKKQLLSIITFSTLSLGAAAQNVTIPDANFKAYLVGNTAINTNGDTEIQVSEASAFSGTINVNGNNISDLTGIEAFVNINFLNAMNNQLTTVDLSANTSMNNLYIGNNNLTSIILPSVLGNFKCQNNNLTSLDISAISDLIGIDCSNNELTTLNIANGTNTGFGVMNALNNPNLTCIEVDNVSWSNSNWSSSVDQVASFSLDCTPCTVSIPDANFKSYLVGNTAINTNGNTEIECTEASAFSGTIACGGLVITDLTGIEAFTALTVLNFHNCQVTSVDLSTNIALETLACIRNGLTGLDLSANTALTFVNCSENELTFLNLANGNNEDYVFMEAINNPNLTCIQHDAGFDPSTKPYLNDYSTGWGKDFNTSWSSNCSQSVGVNNFESSEIKTYPNPTNGLVTFNTEDFIQLIEVYNLTGQKVLEFNNVNTIDISSLPNGTYTAKLIVGSSNPTIERLIKH